jgi:hypothetical protein
VLAENDQVVKSGVSALKAIPESTERIMGVLITFGHQENSADRERSERILF